MSWSCFVFCESRYQGSELWSLVATFEIGLARRFHGALAKAGLGDRGLPDDLSESVGGHHRELADRPAGEGPFGETWVAGGELPHLLPASRWLSDNELERFPGSAHGGHAESDTVRAWLAFARAHETAGNPTRFAVWFVW